MTATFARGFRCFVLGDGALAQRAAELVLGRGHTLCGVATSDAAVRAWSAGRGIPVAPRGTSPAAFLGATTFDYLFSIASPELCSDEVVRLPGRGAINYHQAPLPGLGGRSAPSWAILNRESEWAVSWHTMVVAPEAGELLCRTAVPILEGDTALTLGRRCDEAGLAGFREVLAALETGTSVATSPDLPARTYSSRSERPEAAGVLLWDRPAEELSALVRALDFGPAPNRLGLPKVLVNGTCLTVSTLTVADGPAVAEPGTVLAVSDSAITVATATGPVAVGGWAGIDSGVALRPPELVRRFGLQVGSRFELPDAAKWLVLCGADAAAAGQEEFWSGVLAGARPVAYPGGRARPSGKRRLSRLRWKVPEPTLAALSAAGLPGPRCSWLLAAWGAFLGRMSGLACFDIAFPVCDTSLPWSDLGDVFAAQVPLRFETDDETTLRGLLQTMGGRLEALLERRTYPRDLVARRPELHSLAAGGRGLVLPAGAAIVGGSSGVAGAMDCDLLLLMDEETTEVALRHDPDVFGLQEAARALEHFQAFWGELAAAPEAPLSRLSLLGPVERHRILREWNATRADVPADVPLHRLFEAQVAKRPHASAVQQESRTLTYRDLNRRANRLARRLRAQGVGHGIPVGLSVRRSCEMVVGMLAILKAGGAYVPLDPSSPEERLSLLLELTGVNVVVTTPGCFIGGAEGDLVVVPVDAPGSDDGPAAEEDLPDALGGRHLAYVLPTSEAGGTPRAVMIEQGSLVNFVNAAVERYALGPAESVLQFAPFTATASVEEIFPPLVAGATVVLRTAETTSSAAHFRKVCQDWAITRLFLPTSYWHHLCAQMDSAGWRLPEAVQLVVLGGDVAAPGALAAWRRHVGRQVRLLNTYGSAETTVVAAWCDLGGHGEEPGGPLPIGRPLPNVRALVLDRHLQPVPVGVAGELCIGGRGLARGYLGQPELTTACFVPNPHDDGETPRLFRSGDRAVVRADGLIVHLGRLGSGVESAPVVSGTVRGPAAPTAGSRLWDRLRDAAPPVEVRGEVDRLAVPAAELDAEAPQFVADVVPRTVRAPEAPPARSRLCERLQDDTFPAEVVVLPPPPVEVRGAVGSPAVPAEPEAEVEILKAPVDPASAADGVAPRTVQVPEAPPPRSRLCERLQDDTFRARVVELRRAPVEERGAAEVRAVPTPASAPPRADLPPVDDVGGAPSSLELEGDASAADGAISRLRQSYYGDLSSRAAPDLSTERDPSESAPAEGFLLELRREGHRPPLFIIPGGWGGPVEVQTFAQLATDLAPGRPLYVIRSRAADEALVEPKSLREQAVRVLGEVRAVRPQGTFLFLGECLAATMAMELAALVEEEGEPPGTIVLLDPNTPPRFGRLRQWLTSVFLSVSPGPPPRVLRYLRLLDTWRPRALRSEVHLIASSSLRSPTGVAQAWQRMVGRKPHLRVVKGTHLTYLREAAAETVGVLNDILGGA